MPVVSVPVGESRNSLSQGLDSNWSQGKCSNLGVFRENDMADKRVTEFVRVLAQTPAK